MFSGGWTTLPALRLYVTPRRNRPAGFCIRCKAAVAANPEKPYCADCYSTWRRYSDPDYEDNYCHICKAEYAATMLKPLCASCHKKYKDMFQFATA